jgi:type II secretory pathway pseudopilin PulG
MKNRASGMSLLEIMIAMSILSLTFLAMLSLITSSSRVQDEAGERTLAYNAARRVVEEMRALPLAEVYRRYNSATSDNLAGANPGDAFTVDGLPKGVGGGTQGRVLFPEGATAGTLSESPADPLLAADLGMPKDLNRNGSSTETGLTSYHILPVKVEVEWVLPAGKTGRVQVVTYLSER